MRERAQAAVPGPWDDAHRLVKGDGGRTWVAETSAPESAPHVAGWHPCVALAVADLLDAEADWATGRPGYVSESACVRIARTYLGDLSGGAS